LWNRDHSGKGQGGLSGSVPVQAVRDSSRERVRVRGWVVVLVMGGKGGGGGGGGGEKASEKQ